MAMILLIDKFVGEEIKKKFTGEDSPSLKEFSIYLYLIKVLTEYQIIFLL
jgi:hypothetical protein